MQQIILLKDVEKLGRRGGLVRVKDGFALNYLLPKGFGVRATPDNLKRLEGLREKFEAEEKERTDKAHSLSDRLSKVSITIPAKASAEGHLYGSVSVSSIVEALAVEGIEVDARAVRLAEPIKEIGVYTIPVVLHDQVRTELKVWVVEEKEAAVEPSPGSGAAAS
ncbi:MAG: 50S ribosomal protein L9 [Planctomycetes bacterium]|nr:50S ribosomal protein L9 [Planctomycetota bacterium]